MWAEQATKLCLSTSHFSVIIPLRGMVLTAMELSSELMEDKTGATDLAMANTEKVSRDGYWHLVL